MKINYKILLLCILMLIILNPSQLILAEDMKFDFETAQQLMNYDWELISKENEEPIIIYLLKFVRLNNEFMTPLRDEMKINLSENKLNKFDINISTDKSLLSLVGDKKLAFVKDISDFAEINDNTDELSSWMSTVGKNSVSVLLNEKSVVENNDIYKLEIKLKPDKIDIANERILTYVTLDYSNRASQLTNTTTKAWIENKVSSPVAMLSKEEIDGERRKTAYYALYLVSSIITADKLEEDTPVIIGGSLRGINNLFEKSKGDIYIDDKKISLTVSNDSISINGYHKGSINKYLDIDYYYENTFSYDIGIDIPIFKGEGLCISSKVSNTFDRQNAVLQLGMTDAVKYKETTYKLTYLPFSKNISGNLITDYSELKLELINPEVNFWYQNINSKIYQKDQIGMILNLNSQLGLKACYDLNQDKNMSFGLIWRFYQGK